jgi:hypothetical protein
MKVSTVFEGFSSLPDRDPFRLFFLLSSGPDPSLFFIIIYLRHGHHPDQMRSYQSFFRIKISLVIIDKNYYC